MSDIPLIPDGGRVIAAVDASAHARGVADLAAWAAQRLGVPLEVLHAIERDATSPPADFSGSLSLGSQEALLAELAAHDEQRGQLVQRQGRTLLDQVRAHLRASAGVEAEGNRLTLRGFGKFYPQDHKGHRVRFADGSPDGSGVIPDYTVLKFSATRDVNRRLGAPTQGRASP